VVYSFLYCKKINIYINSYLVGTGIILRRNLKRYNLFCQTTGVQKVALNKILFKHIGTIYTQQQIIQNCKVIKTYMQFFKNNVNVKKKYRNMNYPLFNEKAHYKAENKNLFSPYAHNFHLVDPSP